MRYSAQNLVLFLAFSLSAGASTISAPVNFLNVTGSGTVTTPNPGNNNAVGDSSPNLLVVSETVNPGAFAAGSWGFNFSIFNNALSTEYFVTKTVLNDSGSTWNTFSMFFGLGGITDPNLNLVNSGVITFDEDTTPTLNGAGTSLQSVQSFGPNYIQWGNLNIPTGSTIVLTFSVDTCRDCTGIWQIQQAATPGATPDAVPEPSTFALIGLSLLICRFRPNWNSQKSSLN